MSWGQHAYKSFWPSEYKDHYACFECRWTFREYNSMHTVEEKRCPNCGATAYNVGVDFHAPKRRDLRGWEKAAILFKKRGRFISENY